MPERRTQSHAARLARCGPLAERLCRVSPRARKSGGSRLAKPAHAGHYRPMKLDVLSAILDGQKSVRRDGHNYILDDTASATVFAGATGEVISVPRFVGFERGREVCTLVTGRHERFFFPYELVLGLKREQSDEPKHVPAGAGFR